MSRDTFCLKAFLKAFDSVPEGLAWSMDRIKESLLGTLSEREPNSGMWVFAAGSLMWNPGVAYEQRCVATLEGYRRSFCLRMIAGRGSQELPGRMLALESGGMTHGVAYRLQESLLQDALLALWRREMVMGSYIPHWLRVTLQDNTHVAAIVFVANVDRPQYQSDSTVSVIAPLIARAFGPLGSNVDYVRRLKRALDDEGIVDTYVDELHVELSQYCEAP